MDDETIKVALAKWLEGYAWDNCLALTMTFPPAVARDRHSVEPYLLYFWNHVDARVYGNLSRRRKAYRVQRVCTIEPGANRDNYHSHVLLKVPSHTYATSWFRKANGMTMLLRQVWQKRMNFNEKKTFNPCDISPIPDGENNLCKWQKYVTKEVTNWNMDAVCLRTTWLGDGKED